MAGKQEKKKMAIINLTCDHPNVYCVAELAKWVKLSTWSVRKLMFQLDLDISISESRGRGGRRLITGMTNYFKKEYEDTNIKR